MAIAEISRELASATRKNVTVNEHFTVRNFGRNDFHAADFERCSDFVGFGADVIAEGMLSVKSIVKDTPQIGHGMRRSVNGHGPVGHFAKAAEVIEPRDMIGMGVGEDDGVEAP